MTSRDINDLCPEAQTLCREFMAQCKAAGIDARQIVTYRGPAEQNAAKAAGLSNAAAGQSPHNYCDADGKPASRAFDFGIFEDHGVYITDGEDERYLQAGEIGEGVGLSWGGRWQHPDYDHMELRNWKTLT